MKIFFLLNPTRVKNHWDWRDVAARYAKRFGWTPRFGEVDRTIPNSTQRHLAQAIEEDCSRIVVVGGDGTMHRTINVLSQMKMLSRIEVAVVPAGTCNDFARYLALNRRRWEIAIRLACSGKARPFDLGLMGRELFLNNAGFGRRPSVPGKRAIPIPMHTLRAFRPIQLKAQWDKGSIYGLFYMGLICNAPFFSGGLHFSKNIHLNDNQLDLYMIPAMSKWKLLPILALGRLGRPARFKRLFTVRASALEIQTNADIWPQADGEPPIGPTRRATFSVSTEKAMIVAP